VVADVGAGTGKLARLLVEEASFVFGVEPNHDMAVRLHAELGHHRNFIAVEGRGGRDRAAALQSGAA
jgi:16S rRNA A1518/A1519 N6-dimethyltransferase RsmA/KsgA/DIM1 with predicted DNA glycosylase/AP lyase activity